MWRYTGRDRPRFAAPPGPGHESVWDYPRPPCIEPDAREVTIQLGAVLIARSTRALRVLETASPPTFYLPWDDLAAAHLQRCPGQSACEWKGLAGYWAVVAGSQRLDAVAWSYEAPRPAFAALRGHLGFYPGRLDCFVGGIRVLPQPGRFYAGWVTPEIVGPFKGEPGSEHW